METPPPLPPQPPPQQIAQQLPPQPGMGCFAKGCLIVVIVGALLLGYRGVLRVVSSRPEEGVGAVVVGVALAVICFMLCRHRHEIADS